MPKLDHSILEELANEGYTPEAAKAKDALLSEGFTLVDEPTPFDQPSPLQAQGPQGAAEGRRGSSPYQGDRRPEEPQRAPQRAEEKPRQAAPSPPGKRSLPPLKSLDGSRDYRKLYRAACDFHERHNPPTASAEYWSNTSDDMTETAQRFDNDPFLTALLIAIFEELEQQYKVLTNTEK